MERSTRYLFTAMISVYEQASNSRETLGENGSSEGKTCTPLQSSGEAQRSAAIRLLINRRIDPREMIGFFSIASIADGESKRLRSSCTIALVRADDSKFPLAPVVLADRLRRLDESSGCFRSHERIWNYSGEERVATNSVAKRRCNWAKWYLATFARLQLFNE